MIKRWKELTEDLQVPSHVEKLADRNEVQIEEEQLAREFPVYSSLGGIHKRK